MAEVADSHLIVASWADGPGLKQLSSGSYGNTNHGSKTQESRDGKRGRGR